MKLVILLCVFMAVAITTYLLFSRRRPAMFDEVRFIDPDTLQAIEDYRREWGPANENKYLYPASRLNQAKAPVKGGQHNPPNMGGFGKPKYKGGNYFHPEEIAEEMIGVQHFGTEK